MKKLTPDLYRLFRDGMALRKLHVKEIFGTEVLELLYPDLIQISKQYAYEGTEKLKSQIEEPIKYDFDLFRKESSDIYYMLKDKKTLKASMLNKLPKAENGKTQIVNALLSGVLKIDTRGYYFDPESRKQLQVQEYLELVNGEE